MEENVILIKDSNTFFVSILIGQNISNLLNSRLVIKIKDGCKLELQTPETMKFFGSTKKLIDVI